MFSLCLSPKSLCLPCSYSRIESKSFSSVTIISIYLTFITKLNCKVMHLVTRCCCCCFYSHTMLYINSALFLLPSVEIKFIYIFGERERKHSFYCQKQAISLESLDIIPLFILLCCVVCWNAQFKQNSFLKEWVSESASEKERMNGKCLPVAPTKSHLVHILFLEIGGCTVKASHSWKSNEKFYIHQNKNNWR